MLRAVVVALAVSSSALVAQQQPLVGEWSVSYTAGMRIENGVATPMTATGTLAVVAQGDSLIGTLTMNPTGDMPARPPARLTALKTDGAVTFTSSSKATLSMNGVEREAISISTWVLTATGDSVSGTVQRRLEGMAMGPQPPGSLTGTRKG